MHAQQQILDAVKAALIAGATVAGARVFLDRVYPLRPEELPAILVYEGSDGERVNQITVHGVQQRELSVQVVAVLAQSVTAAADAREFGLQVEKVLATSVPLDLLAKHGFQIISSRQNNVGEADRLFASREQEWTFNYFVRPDEPDVIL